MRHQAITITNNTVKTNEMSPLYLKMPRDAKSGQTSRSSVLSPPSAEDQASPEHTALYGSLTGQNFWNTDTYKKCKYNKLYIHIEKPSDNKKAQIS